MALATQTQAPDFTLPSTQGSDFTLSQQGKPLIIYFYPKDFTPGCTIEACDFRDNILFFKGFEIDVVGISKDSLETHQKFKEKYGLPFELLSDKKGEVAKLYKALVPLINIPKRISYLLDKDRKIVAIYENFFGARKHIQEMIQQIKNAELVV